MIGVVVFVFLKFYVIDILDIPWDNRFHNDVTPLDSIVVCSLDFLEIKIY